MNFQTITTRSVLADVHYTLNGVMTGKPDPMGKVSYEMDGQQHNLEFDGRIEEPIRQSMMNPDRGIYDLKHLTGLCTDKDGVVSKARAALAQQSDKSQGVGVDLGRLSGDAPEIWKMTNGGGNSLVFKNDDQVIRLSSKQGVQYVSITAMPFVGEENTGVTQKVVGKWEPELGAIRCIREEVTHTRTVPREVLNRQNQEA